MNDATVYNESIPDAKLSKPFIWRQPISQTIWLRTVNYMDVCLACPNNSFMIGGTSSCATTDDAAWNWRLREALVLRNTK